jgi:hypothetical protein
MTPVELESVHFVTPTKFAGTLWHDSPIDAKRLAAKGPHLKGARLYAVDEGVVVVEAGGRQHLCPWQGLGDGCSVTAKGGGGVCWRWGDEGSAGARTVACRPGCRPVGGHGRWRGTAARCRGAPAADPVTGA